MAVGYIYVALACVNVEFLTLGMGSVECLVDEAGEVAVVDAEGKVVNHLAQQFAGGSLVIADQSGCMPPMLSLQ